jgi:hypothetical protein
MRYVKIEKIAKKPYYPFPFLLPAYPRKDIKTKMNESIPFIHKSELAQFVHLYSSLKQVPLLG